MRKPIVPDELPLQPESFDDEPDEPAKRAGEATRVVLVDDDPDFIEALEENLQHAGYETISRTDSTEALEWLLSGGNCDVILLDWYMPDITGIALLKRIRDAGINTPVIVLTGVNKEVVEDTALGCGAVDFVDKSRRLSILLKRIELVLEKGTMGDQPLEVRDVGSLALFPETCRARWKGNEVGLTIVEFRIVHKLAARAGVDCTYREIYDEVHGKGFSAGDGDDGFRINVRSLIKRIRQKFRDVDSEFEQIENYPGYGYRWRAGEGVGEATWHGDSVRETAPCAPD